MKAALLLVLSLSALAYASPSWIKHNNNNKDNNKDNNQINTAGYNTNKDQQQQQYMQAGEIKPTPTTEILKQWCFASQMSQPELTSSFKKLVSTVKSSPTDAATEAAVMSERICQGATGVQQQQQQQQSGADAQAHELIKDVYMDALISCKSQQCTEQLVKIINSNQVDTIRASYYMTRIAVTEQSLMKGGESEIKQLVESFVNTEPSQAASEAVERQKLFAVTALVGKACKQQSGNSKQQVSQELKQMSEQVAKTIVERYIKPVDSKLVQEYKQQQGSETVAKKIAKRNAALKALANIPGYILKECTGVDETLVQIATDKSEQSTARQSAIECLEQNDKQCDTVKQIAFSQDEPTEVRVAAYRALMTCVAAASASNEKNEKNESNSKSQKQEMAAQIVATVIEHCKDERNQQDDSQFVLYAISHLDNVRTSQQPEHAAVKEAIAKNKQHYMQIQVLCKKLKQQLGDVRKSSRNYKLEQEFNQLESGLVLEGDLIYGEQMQSSESSMNVLPKLVRVNVSMPVMGQTVNVIELSVRQNEMDDEILGALKLVQDAKLSQDSMAKVVDSFKSAAQSQQDNANNKKKTYNTYNNKQTTGNKVAAEADLTIKVEGCTVVYLCLDDFKAATQSQQTTGNKRQTRSVYSQASLVDEIIEHLKRKPIAFNRGFNLNFNERLGKVLDIDANIVAGLRFESRAHSTSAFGVGVGDTNASDNFEISAKIEPRFGFEAIVGPAKMSNKKVLQRVSTKTALGVRLRFKSDELVDVQVDLPMNTMELFTVETQMVEQHIDNNNDFNSYNYLKDSIYGQADIYAPDEIYAANYDDSTHMSPSYASSYMKKPSAYKRSQFAKAAATGSGLMSFMGARKSYGAQSYGTIAHSYETPESVARATGLRAAFRFVVSPKDMSLLVSAVAQKVEPQMQGFRMQLERVGGNSRNEQQFVARLSTPGSSVDRTMQMRVVKSYDSARSSIKCELESPQMGASFEYDLVHDGRVYALKALARSLRPSGEWRHFVECGVVRGSHAHTGRIVGSASSFKPYLSVESSSLARPIQLQGSVSYQMSPKTVISYELKCPTSGDFVQGKVIVDERSGSSMRMKMRSVQRSFAQRSMRSPLELIAASDITLTGELVGQVQEHALKIHKALEWDSKRYSLQADSSVAYKNARKPSLNGQLVTIVKLAPEQQVFSIERRWAQQSGKQFRVAIASEMRSPAEHLLSAECRYNGRRAQPATIAYKHEIKMQQVGAGRNSFDCSAKLELVDTERRISEQLVGRARVALERRQKLVDAEMSSRASKLAAKLNLDFVSLDEHKCSFVIQSERAQHKTEFRSNKRQFALQSRTDNKQTGQLVAKIGLELEKQARECKLVAEIPSKRTYVACDLKTMGGKVSSIAVQTPRFTSKGEFTFETLVGGRPFAGGKSRGGSMLGAMLPKLARDTKLRFKTDLRDMDSKDAYWMESAWNGDMSSKSFVRAHSPLYRADFELEPMDESARFGAFKRSKRSIGGYDYEQMYSQRDSALEHPIDAASMQKIADKLWIARSIISSPAAMGALKAKARRALFEYADRRNVHKHAIDYEPSGERINFELATSPISSGSFLSKPARASGAFGLRSMRTGAGSVFNTNDYDSNNNKLNIESEFADVDFDARPFDGEQMYAKLKAVSRHPRSAFSKHESELKYKKHEGYKAWMKHEDKDARKHAAKFESDESPKKWSKMSFESDKLGKADYEHKWRKHAQKKRDTENGADESTDDEQMMYESQVSFGAEPNFADWTHRSSFALAEPRELVDGELYGDSDSDEGAQRRQRRSIFGLSQQQPTRYGVVDYLKRVEARANSQSRNKLSNEIYGLDFDYKPQMKRAKLNVDLADEMAHESVFELEPRTQLYKMHSKLYNRRTNEPTYELGASTKYAQSVGEFVDEQHPMLQRPISALFKQPVSFDYTDKFGRVARLDYEHAPVESQIANMYKGLRAKRAAVYYKDAAADTEHSAQLDFYPETVWGRFKAGERNHNDLSYAVSTKYGPVSVRVDSNERGYVAQMKSPIVDGQLVGARTESGPMKIKIQLSNEHQQVKLAKLVRKTPIAKECSLAHKLAQKFDAARFEHQTELELNGVDMAELVIKMKSLTSMDKRPVMQIEGAWIGTEQKAFAKVNGERTDAQLVVDLIEKSIKLAAAKDNKRIVEHMTRLSQISNQFYVVESMTSYKNKPVFKLQGKMAAALIEDPMHLFSFRQHAAKHPISTLEAVLYEPKHINFQAKLDCDKKEIRIIGINNDEERKVESVIRYDESEDNFLMSARLQQANEEVYNTKTKINWPGLIFDQDTCYAEGLSCKSSEFFYQKSKNWGGNTYAAKYVPGEFISLKSPHGSQMIKVY